MGLFSRALGGNQNTIQFDVQKAIMLIVVAAIKADGDVSDSEIGRLRSMCARSPIFEDNSSSEDDRLIDFADGMVNQLGAAAITQASDFLPMPLRETAFSFAAEMLLADGMVGAKEEEFAAMLSSTLELDQSVVDAIISATVIRMRNG